MFTLVNHVLKGEYFLLTQLTFIFLSILAGVVFFPEEYLITFQTIQSLISGTPISSEVTIPIILSIYVTNGFVNLFTSKIAFNSPGILFSLISVASHISTCILLIIFRYAFFYHTIQIPFISLWQTFIITIGSYSTFRYFWSFKKYTISKKIQDELNQEEYVQPRNK